MVCAGWLCGFAGVGGVGEVSAEPIRRFSVEYMSAPGCPARERFVSGVEGRTALARFAPGSPGVRVSLSVVRVESRAEPFSATLRIDGDVVAPRREFSSASCEELVSAAALIVALAIDPEATTAPRSEPSRLPAAPQDAPVAPRATLAESRQAEGPRLGLGLAGSLGITSGVGDGVSPVVALTAKLRRALAPGWNTAFWLRGMYSPGSAESAVGSASLTLIAARGGVAPYVLLGDVWSLEPSLTFDFGRLRARGESVPNAASDSAPWLGPGVELALGRSLCECAGGNLSLSAQLGGMWSLTRDYFYFRKDSPGAEDRVFEQLAWVGYAALGAELSW